MPVLGHFQYDADYYERGLETGLSAYQNYRWMPEHTMSMAMTIIDYLQIQRHSTILDFGCAKGFLVKALRLLGRDAWGVDSSLYAIEHRDDDVERYCHLKGGNILIDVPRSFQLPTSFDLCIAKDVFEHIEKKELVDVLDWIPSRKLFVIVPLGNGDNYVAPSNNLDYTHINVWSMDKWCSFLHTNGWEVRNCVYRIDGIKDSYYEKYPKAHAFITAGRR